MKPQYVNGNVQALCPDCGVITTFEFKENLTEFGTVVPTGKPGRSPNYFKLLRCAGCGRGGMAIIRQNPNSDPALGQLEDFLPRSVTHVKVPKDIPKGILMEFREAENYASVGAWRGAASLLRSVLDKVLTANGYGSTNAEGKRNTIEDCINEVARDGLITEARKVRAHSEIRVVANDILHGDWRIITEDEFDTAHHYVQRILEDFYDDRDSVESVLRKKGRWKEKTETPQG